MIQTPVTLQLQIAMLQLAGDASAPNHDDLDTGDAPIAMLQLPIATLQLPITTI